MLPNLTIFDGEILEEKIDLKDSSRETSISENISENLSIRKPRIVSAITLLLEEIDCLDDLDELKKKIELKSKTIRDNSDVFTVWPKDSIQMDNFVD